MYQLRLIMICQGQFPDCNKHIILKQDVNIGGEAVCVGLWACKVPVLFLQLFCRLVTSLNKTLKKGDIRNSTSMNLS